MSVQELNTRTVDVRCDECRSVTQITVEAPTWQTENQWDQLVVLQLIELGWRAGQEPKAHHQRTPRDICPGCRSSARAKELGPCN